MKEYNKDVRGMLRMKLQKVPKSNKIDELISGLLVKQGISALWKRLMS